MAMLIFAWKLGPPWHGIAFAAENTGLGHVFPNKGGLLAKMEVWGPWHGWLVVVSFLGTMVGYVA